MPVNLQQFQTPLGFSRGSPLTPYQPYGSLMSETFKYNNLMTPANYNQTSPSKMPNTATDRTFEINTSMFSTRTPVGAGPAAVDYQKLQRFGNRSQ